jgi:proline dehydrogenase
MRIEMLYRQGLLTLAEAKPVASFVQRQGWRLGVGRFVAGETLEEALPALHLLEQNGLKGILDLLGEFVSTPEGVEAMMQEILRTLDVLEHEPLDRYMSVKPTQLGLGISQDLALANSIRIATRAQEVGAHVCLDMENYPYVDGTLALYRALHAQGYRNVSTVLQSYLHRSMQDLHELLRLEPKPTLRVVKGAYRESPEVAMQDKRLVDENYHRMMREGLEAGAKIGIATHDERIIQEAGDFVREASLDRERYEFQLLYGVRTALQRRLAARGHTVRIYVPYGEDWYGYFSRRLAERPANLLFVLRGMFG